jgi:hypothetical protein
MELGGFEPPTSWVRYKVSFSLIPQARAVWRVFLKRDRMWMYVDIRADTRRYAAIPGTRGCECLKTAGSVQTRSDSPGGRSICPSSLDPFPMGRTSEIDGQPPPSQQDSTFW